MSISDVQGGEIGIRPWRSWCKSHFLKKEMYYEHFSFKVSFHACFLQHLNARVRLATQVVTKLVTEP